MSQDDRLRRAIQMTLAEMASHDGVASDYE